MHSQNTVTLNKIQLVFECLLFNNHNVFCRYTYGQPVPGSVKVKVCRPLRHRRYYVAMVTPDNPEGLPDITPPCYEETKEVQLTESSLSRNKKQSVTVFFCVSVWVT